MSPRDLCLHSISPLPRPAAARERRPRRPRRARRAANEATSKKGERASSEKREGRATSGKPRSERALDQPPFSNGPSSPNTHLAHLLPPLPSCLRSSATTPTSCARLPITSIHPTQASPPRRPLRPLRPPRPAAPRRSLPAGRGPLDPPSPRSPSSLLLLLHRHPPLPRAMLLPSPLRLQMRRKMMVIRTTRRQLIRLTLREAATRPKTTRRTSKPTRPSRP